MKYKPGDEFIITVKSGVTSVTDDEPNYLMDGIFCLYESTLDKLKSYDEIKERLELIDELKLAEYQRGLADAWTCMRNIANDKKISEIREMFGIKTGGCHISDILLDFKPEEAIEKLRAYEERQKIHVGDEITLLNGLHAVVIKTADSTGKIVSMMSNGNVCSSLKEQVKKTGKHFEEVSTVQDKLLESEEDET